MIVRPLGRQAKKSSMSACLGDDRGCCISTLQRDILDGWGTRNLHARAGSQANRSLATVSPPVALTNRVSLRLCLSTDLFRYLSL